MYLTVGSTEIVMFMKVIKAGVKAQGDDLLHFDVVQLYGNEKVTQCESRGQGT